MITNITGMTIITIITIIAIINPLAHTVDYHNDA